LPKVRLIPGVARLACHRLCYARDRGAEIATAVQHDAREMQRLGVPGIAGKDALEERVGIGQAIRAKTRNRLAKRVGNVGRSSPLR